MRWSLYYSLAKCRRLVNGGKSPSLRATSPEVSKGREGAKLETEAVVSKKIIQRSCFNGIVARSKIRKRETGCFGFVSFLASSTTKVTNGIFFVFRRDFTSSMINGGIVGANSTFPKNLSAEDDAAIHISITRKRKKLLKKKSSSMHCMLINKSFVTSSTISSSVFDGFSWRLNVGRSFKNFDKLGIIGKKF